MLQKKGEVTRISVVRNTEDKPEKEEKENK